MSNKHSSFVNDKSKPLVFVGSSITMYTLTELCEDLGIEVAGIIDSDYYGNTDQICGIDVIASEQQLANNPEQLDLYRSKYNFFCATNWIPVQTPVDIRNREKRNRLIDFIEHNQLSAITLIDPSAKISKYTKIGRGVLLDAYVLTQANSEIGDFSTIYYNVFIGHDCVVGRNCVFQRQSLLAAESIVGNDVYIASWSKAMKDGGRIGSGTFVQEAIYLKRNTVENEVVSLNGANTCRVSSVEERICE